MAKILSKLSFSDAAYEILKAQKQPLTPSEIVDIAIRKGLIITNSKRPGGTMAARVWADKRFVSAGNGRWTLE